jgi:hypothetical protein
LDQRAARYGAHREPSIFRTAHETQLRARS